MKNQVVIIVLMLMFSTSVFAQEKPDDLQKVKDALVIQVLKTQELEKKNGELTSFLTKLGEELKAVKTIQQLDSLKTFYGLAEKESKAKK